MSEHAPTLEHGLRRVLETPSEFLDEPRIGQRGVVVVAAVVNDLLYQHGATVPASALARFCSSNAKADRNRLALVLLACWLLADETLLARRPTPAALLALLDGTMAELAAGAAAERYVNDPERREELVRHVLAGLDLIPAGETAQQASDRLSAISGSERRRLLEASRAAEERAREVRLALARKAAEESADKWTRE